MNHERCRYIPAIYMYLGNCRIKPNILEHNILWTMQKCDKSKESQIMNFPSIRLLFLRLLNCLFASEWPIRVYIDETSMTFVDRMPLEDAWHYNKGPLVALILSSIWLMSDYLFLVILLDYFKKRRLIYNAAMRHWLLQKQGRKT